MPLQATSGAASYDAFGGGVPFEPTYIEQVFATHLYTGNGSTQTITNGIDLAGKGGLVWLKGRSLGYSHGLFDTVRGANFWLNSASTDPSTSVSGIPANPWITGFNSNGFGLGSNGSANNNGTTYASWTFRRQPRFFQCGVDTNNPGMGGRAITHGLGSTPGCVIIKRIDSAEDWFVWHRSLPNGDDNLILNSTAAVQTNFGVIYNVNSTTFTLNGATGGNYVWYVFAHNAGGFGLTGTDNVISCGSYTGNGSTTGPVINLGYEPQWVMIKRATGGTGSWRIYDTMRGWITNGDGQVLYPNLSSAESTTLFGTPTATGFQLMASAADVNASGSTYIYIAIRRGPMRTPTSGTSVFAPIAVNNSTGTVNTTGFPVDMQMPTFRPAGGPAVFDRLRGISSTATASGLRLRTSQTDAENSDPQTQNWSNTGFATPFAFAGGDMVYWNFRRAPGFFDVVCYTGTGSARTINHNLGAVPEFMIVKTRNTVDRWFCYSATLGNKSLIYLNENFEAFGPYAPTASMWNSTTPTSTVFSVGGSGWGTNDSGTTYVAYLFASCPGVSKIGSYTGTGATQTIDCGFTGGARFVMVKRTDSTGNWMVVDTARGLVAAGDPTLYLNSTAAEVTGVDWLDPDSSGFIVNQEGTMNANVNGGTYIYLAIA